MSIRHASIDDLLTLLKYDIHIKEELLKESILQNRVYVVEDKHTLIGILRYNLFWDNTPFLNFLYVIEQYRNQRFGSELVNYYENEMKKLGYFYLMLSTPSNETSKFFYRKHNYKRIGSFKYLDDPLEIIMAKKLK